MKKSSLALFILPALLLVTAASANALEVSIDAYGTTTLRQDQVLGETTETTEQQLRATPKPTQRVTTQQEKLIRIRNSAENQNLELVDKRQPAQTQPETFSANSLNITLTTSQKEERLKKLEEARLKQEIHSKAVEQTREERKERLQEKIELHRADEASGAGLYLKTREMTARIRDGQEVVIDPETNEVGLMLPNGEIKAVNFLPDQAVERLGQYLEQASSAEEPMVELRTLEDGTVAYQLNSQKTKRLFGFLSRNVPTSYVLNDETGEVEEQPLPRTNFERLLDFLSL